jgi:maltose O-acetyltransferase
MDDLPSAPITIEDDAWLGFNSVVLRGVTIGAGAIVGAASVVTKDVMPFSVVAGNPARIVGESRP